MKIYYKLIIYGFDGILSNGKLCADVVSAIKAQRKLGCKIAFVSSGSKPHVDYMFKALSSKCSFDYVAFDATPSKTPTFQDLCIKVGVEANETCCISDSIADLSQAYKASIAPIGILRYGPELAELMYAAGAVRVLTSLDDLAFDSAPSIVPALDRH
jgi:phosphoglycolate phosphatase-like HAD superfamily hydrolase